ncbi:MAG TPA: 2-phosphosulfolactate phosphatase [Microbacteriaceae bacterium]|nr:2-phosphosulfolactate phosphatase [Microbacteriaceae bacterium]
MSSFDQSNYQVRFDWGIDGLARLEPADVIVVVDVLRFSTAATRAIEAGREIVLRPELSRNGAPIAHAAREHAARGATVLIGCLRNRGAIADAIVAEQHARGGRMSVVVIAAGERAARRTPLPMLLGASVPQPGQHAEGGDENPEHGGHDPQGVDQERDAAQLPRFAVEDLLGAGAIIDALITRGIDHCSPEASVAAEGFAALQHGLGHLLGASGSGRELAAAGLDGDVAYASALDASSAVAVLRDGVLVRREA